jgi:LAO/AO transport system kinase
MKDFTRHLLNELQLNEHVASTQEEQASIRLRKRMALARSITLVERTNSAHRGEADLLLTQLLSSKQENDSNNTYLRVGIAGPPGAGKSSFIETFGSFLLNGENDKDTYFNPDKLAVVCIDPSSTVTGGSILGDKTRMMNQSQREHAYVGPSSIGGTFGGLSDDTNDVVSLCFG